MADIQTYGDLKKYGSWSIQIKVVWLRIRRGVAWCFIVRIRQAQWARTKLLCIWVKCKIAYWKAFETDSRPLLRGSDKSRLVKLRIT